VIRIAYNVFAKISHVPGKSFDETFTRKFRQKISNFRAKIFGNLSHEILTKVSLPQHYSYLYSLGLSRSHSLGAFWRSVVDGGHCFPFSFPSGMHLDKGQARILSQNGI